MANTLLITLQTNLATFQAQMASAVSTVSASTSAMNSSLAMLSRGFGTLGVAVTGLTAILGSNELLKIADDYNQIDVRIKGLTRSTQEYTQVTKQLNEIANKNGIAFDSTAQTFASLTRSAKEFGGTNQQVLKVTNAVQQLGAISGASGESMKSALAQFGQALGSGKLQGDELRSIMENMPELASRIADGLGVSRGALKKLGETGELTAEKVFGSLLKQTDKINEQFSAMPISMERSMTATENTLKQLVSQLDKATGATKIVAFGFQKISEAVGQLAVQAGPFLVQLGAQISGVGKVLLTDLMPLLQQLRPLFNLIIGEMLMRWEMVKIGLEALAPIAMSLARNFIKALTMIIPAGEHIWKGLSTLATNTWSVISTGAKKMVDSIIDAVNKMHKSFSTTVSNIGEFFTGLLKTIGVVADQIAPIFGPGAQLMLKVFEITITQISNLFGDMFKGIAKMIPADAMAGLSKLLPKEQFESVKKFIDGISSGTAAFSSGVQSSLGGVIATGEKLNKIWMDYHSKDYIGAVAREGTKAWNELQAVLNKTASFAGASGPVIPLDPNAGKKGKEPPEFSQFKIDMGGDQGLKQLADFHKEIAGWMKRENDLKMEAQKLITEERKSAKEILESLQQQTAEMQKKADGDWRSLAAQQAIEKVSKLSHLRDSESVLQQAEYLRILSDVTKELTKQANIKGLHSADEMIAGLNEELKLLEEKRKGVVAIEKETEKLAELEKLALDPKQMAQYKKMVEELTGKIKAEKEAIEQQTKTLNTLMSSTKSYAEKLKELNKLQSEGKITASQYEDALKKIADSYNKAKDSAEAFINKTISGFADALVSGKSFKEVLKDLGKELLQLAAKKFLIDPLSKALTKGLFPGLPGVPGTGQQGGAPATGGGGIGGWFQKFFGNKTPLPQPQVPQLGGLPAAQPGFVTAGGAAPAPGLSGNPIGPSPSEKSLENISGLLERIGQQRLGPIENYLKQAFTATSGGAWKVILPMKNGEGLTNIVQNPMENLLPSAAGPGGLFGPQAQIDSSVSANAFGKRFFGGTEGGPTSGIGPGGGTNASASAPGISLEPIIKKLDDMMTEFRNLMTASGGGAWKVFAVNCPCPTGAMGGGTNGSTSSETTNSTDDYLKMALAQSIMNGTGGGGGMMGGEGQPQAIGKMVGGYSDRTSAIRAMAEDRDKQVKDISQRDINPDLKTGQILNVQGTWANAMRTAGESQNFSGYSTSTNNMSGGAGRPIYQSDIPNSSMYSSGYGSAGNGQAIASMNSQPQQFQAPAPAAPPPGFTGGINRKPMYAPSAPAQMWSLPGAGAVPTTQTGTMLPPGVPLPTPDILNGTNPAGIPNAGYSPVSGNPFTPTRAPASSSLGPDYFGGNSLDPNNPPATSNQAALLDNLAKQSQANAQWYKDKQGVYAPGPNSAPQLNKQMDAADAAREAAAAEWIKTNGMQARARGGPVHPGGAYMVGEQGKEMFSPQEPGQIIPNNMLGGTNVTVNNHTSQPIEASNVNADGGNIEVTLANLMANQAGDNPQFNRAMRRQFNVQNKGSGRG